MGRSRVMSFMSAFGAPRSPTTASSPSNTQPAQQEVQSSSSPQHMAGPARDSPTPRPKADRPASRPMSMVQTYQPPLMEIAQDTIPELLPIFTFLNSHSNKLYQEGYFLKLNDLDSHGRPNVDRSWTECFAQLVGTIMSLWDAAALDAAGQDGEVAPKFINLADASIKMIETLPTRSQGDQPLQNVLSISTAGKNRYLFHFNSLHSLTQWTAGIRLAMFEHATLQEAYTGSLIAGKGKSLNNIKVIMDRTKLKTEDWTRVRFGAGTPWRRCWCVISPPDEKDIQKQNKSLKKKSAYDRPVQALKGDIKFYDTRKTKKTQPIATINDAYSAYAIYPQSKPLIDQSSLVKVEGNITIHSTPETTTEGFVFVMPEVHPGVTGFEMMLRWLFPLYDVFALYGRPNRLVADTLDVRSLMFAMPQERRYGYLEILDVAQLIHENGSQTWKEKEWRRRLKELTSSRIAKLQSNGNGTRSRASTFNRGHRNSLPSRTEALRYDDAASVKSTPSLRNDAPPFPPPHHTGYATPEEGPFQPSRNGISHQRSVSEAVPFSTYPTQRSQRATAESQQNYPSSRLSYEATPSGMPHEPMPPMPPMPPAHQAPPPMPPIHGVPIATGARKPQMQRYAAELDGANDRSSSESERRARGYAETDAQEIRQDLCPASPPTPVVAPPAFVHEPGAKPQKRPVLSPELRRATSRMSIATLSQLASAGQPSTIENEAVVGVAAPWRSNGYQGDGRHMEDQGHRGVTDATSKSGTNADFSPAGEGVKLAGSSRSTSDYTQPSNTSFVDSPYKLHNQSPEPGTGLLLPNSSTSRNISPLSQFPLYPRSHTPPPLPESSRNGVQGTVPQQQEGLPSEASSNISTTANSHPPPVPISRPPPIPIDHERPDLRRLSTSRSITRKPVPGTVPLLPAELPTPVSRSSLESLRYRVVDEDALNQVIARQQDPSDTDNFNHRQQNDIGSIYDGDSTASPDYASTRPSIETGRSKPSMDRPRRGVMKTVGTAEPELQKEVVIGDVHYDPNPPKVQPAPAIPSVDFGPTKAYAPGYASRSTVDDTTAQAVHERSKSWDRLTPSPQFIPSPRNETPRDSNRGVNTHASGQPAEAHERSPSRKLTTPEQHRRTPSGDSEENRRSIAWQPGATIGSGSPGKRLSLTPEQFVQQRAAAGRVMTPVYAHGRKQSGTPPLGSRNSSGEWPIQQHARQASYSKDVPPRPNSRGASTMMSPPADYSLHLSAREQEHVARVTGSPLINMANNTNRQAPQGGGLVGAIEAREQEKKNMKEGLSGQLVQHAIASRQQQSQGQQSRQQSYTVPSQQYPMPGQYPPTPGQYPSMPGQYPQTPGPYTSTSGVGQQQYGWGTPQQLLGQQQQQQQQWAAPTSQAYWGTAQASPHYQHQPQALTYQQQQEHYQQEQLQQRQWNQGQQQPYGPYFGNGQGGR